jgi:integrase
MEWVTRWNDTLAKTDQQGVWRRKDGGFRIRGRTTDPKTGKRREVNRVLPEDVKRTREAAAILEAELARIRSGETAAGKAPGMPPFAKWAVDVFERKLATGDIASASGRAKWNTILRVHLIPAFGDFLVDRITREDVERWKLRELMGAREVAKDGRRPRKLEAGKYSPQTANTILGVLRQVMAEASREFNIRDVMQDVDNLSLRGHRTYTYEDPNSLKVVDVPRFLDEMRCRFPDYYAFVFLGFTTGLRPSSLRPLRWRGPNADVKWDEGKLLVRRSHTEKHEVMDSTKTGIDQIIDLDPEQLAVLRWHVDRMAAENERRAKRYPEIAAAQAASELLFPAAPTRWSHGGGFMSRGVLNKPFRALSLLLKLGYEVSPRAMRRTFQDLARAAGVSDIVTRAISGHQTEAMQRRYSTVGGPEVRRGLADIIDISTGKRRAA